MAAARENADDDDDTVSAARSQRLQNIVEAYIGLLARGGDGATGQVSLETFALADAIRGQSVQKALSASSARSVAKDPALAELVRKEQDLGKQINAQLGALNNALASNVRDENVMKATKATVDKLRTDRAKVRDDINKRFPGYAELIDPKPPRWTRSRKRWWAVRRCCRSTRPARQFCGQCRRMAKWRLLRSTRQRATSKAR